MKFLRSKVVRHTRDCTSMRSNMKKTKFRSLYSVKIMILMATGYLFQPLSNPHRKIQVDTYLILQIRCITREVPRSETINLAPCTLVKVVQIPWIPCQRMNFFIKMHATESPESDYVTKWSKR
jgi:hypothetical protein